MVRISNIITMVLSTMGVLGFAGTARTAALNLNELAAGSAIPFVTTASGVSTEAVITNAGANLITLHFDLINGDPGETWHTNSFVCDLTSRETVQITFTNDLSGGSEVTFECDVEPGSDPAGTSTNPAIISSNAERGVLWVTIQNDVGVTVADNILFADFTIVDAMNAESYSATAAGFQGFIVNDGNRDYKFDGLEYSKFPAALATNYLPPASNPGELLVFTLDGKSNVAPAVLVNLLWFDDDENFQNDSFNFECFDVISYSDIAPGLGTLATPGHLEMFPVDTFQNFSPHAEPGLSRKVPFLCYNIQAAPMVEVGGVLVPGGKTMRPCAQSMSAFVPDGDDSQPHFNTGF